MKKLSIALAALILTVCSVSCGNNSSPTTNTQVFSSTADENMETASGNEIIELNPFENVSFSTTSDLVYPRLLQIQLDSSKSEADSIYQNRGYSITITAAGLDSVKFNVSINDDVVAGLKEQENIIVTPTEKEFELPIEDCPIGLISEKQLTEENKNALIELIKNQMIEAIARDNASYNGDIKDDLTFVSCYMSDVKPDADFIKDYNFKVNGNELINGDTYIDMMFIAIFKNSDDQYFTGDCVPVFYNGSLLSESMNATVRNCSDNEPFTAQYRCFPSVERILSGYEEGKDIIVPLDFPVRELK